MLFRKTETFTIVEFLNQKKDKPKEDIYFFLQSCLKEVEAANPKQKKKFYSILLKTASVSLSVLALATPALAQTPQPAVPGEVDSLLKTIQILCLTLVAGIATLCLMLAGGMRMVGLGEKAKSWSIEILKGTAQVVTAPVVIWLVITLLKALLSPLPGFLNF